MVLNKLWLSFLEWYLPFLSKKQLRQFSIWCAEQCREHITDERLIEAIGFAKNPTKEYFIDRIWMGARDVYIELYHKGEYKSKKVSAAHACKWLVYGYSPYLSAYHTAEWMIVYSPNVSAFKQIIKLIGMFLSGILNKEVSK